MKRLVQTLIGEGTVIEGNLRTKANVRIEGRVEGDIECSGDVTIGRQGMACSNISARSVFNAGVIEGSVRVKEMLTIAKTGKVYGSIQVPVLHIDEGGILEGISRMEAIAENRRVEKSENRDADKPEVQTSANADKPAQNKLISVK